MSTTILKIYSATLATTVSNIAKNVTTQIHLPVRFAPKTLNMMLQKMSAGVLAQ